MKSIVTVLVGIALSLAAMAPASAQPETGSITFSGGSVAADVVYSWADGKLRFAGRDYTFSVHGLSIADQDVAVVDGIGKVVNLRRIGDFSGRYVSTSTDVTGVTGNVVAIENRSGVRIYLQSSTPGRKIDLSAAGIKFTLE